MATYYTQISKPLKIDIADFNFSFYEDMPEEVYNSIVEYIKSPKEKNKEKLAWFRNRAFWVTLGVEESLH